MTAPAIISAQRPSPRRYDLAFLILSLGLVVFVFGNALTGKTLLAPLDLAANFYTQYKWLDPKADGIPKNHYMVDVLDHELPRQYLIFRALRRGEFPWWDPYTDNGRPLVAEAHIGGTDPVRMALYCVLPFELAYNWSKVISSLLFGFGGYWLLRSLGFAGWINVGCGLAYQFASNHMLFQTPLSVTSTFAYYALLWWAWARLAAGFNWGHFIAAALLCACAVLAGNQQSHAYLAIFTLCFLLGYGSRNRGVWKRLLLSTAGSVVLGCLIALPVLTAQIELFLLCHRPAGPGGAPLGWLTGFAAPLALFPWLSGTFRTFDAGRVLGWGAIGFCLYIGSAAVVLAGGGAALYAARKPGAGAIRTAVLLVLAYLFICVTPLLKVLYTRSSDLAVLGLVILSAYALNCLVSGPVEKWPRRVMACLCLGCVGAFLLANAMAFLVVPRIEPKLRRYVLEHDQDNAALPSVPAFRRFQVASLGREISFSNPETVAAVAGAVGLLLLLRARQPAGSRRNVVLWQMVLALNLVPLLLFAHRFIVRQPVQLWDRLLHEDSPQTRLAALLGAQYRFHDPGVRFEHVYPGALAQLYGVHSTIGYTSFHLPVIADEVKALGLNLVSADAGDDLSGPVSLAQRPVLHPPPSGTSRFQWETPIQRSVKVMHESLNQVTIQIAPGPAGTLVRTDRYYPGWRVSQPKNMPFQVLGRSLLAVQVPPEETTITFTYTPRFLSVTLPVSRIALAGCLGAGLWWLLRARKHRF
jgi:hypothetical protein